jgi:transposase
MGSAGREFSLGRSIPIKKLADISCAPECVSRTRMVIHFTIDLPVPGAVNIMEMEREVVCGADIHKQFLLATILSKGGKKFQDRFDTNFEGLLSFRQWLLNHGCQKLAVESTANYWQPIYFVVGKDVEFVLANAYQIKHIPGRKTDTLDSEWIAELCLKDLISPSRIFSEDDRDLRAMTRTRESYVKMRTQAKNRIHQELESACIKLSSVLSDIFGKSGIHIIRGILSGLSIEEITCNIPSKNLKAKKEEIQNAIQAKISPVQMDLIGRLLNSVDFLSREIASIDKQIQVLFTERQEDLKIAMSIPGMGFTSASTILAEVGNFADFKTGERLAAYCGLVPSVYQSAGKLITGHITKHGSPHVRRMLIEVAHAISRTKADSKLKRFYFRIKSMHGAKVAVVALARKVICILHHLIVNREMFEDETANRPKRQKPGMSSSSPELNIVDAIQILVKAGYLVQKRSEQKGG